MASQSPDNVLLHLLENLTTVSPLEDKDKYTWKRVPDDMPDAYVDHALASREYSIWRYRPHTSILL